MSTVILGGIMVMLGVIVVLASVASVAIQTLTEFVSVLFGNLC